MPDGRRLRGISGEEAIRAFERAGFLKVRGKGDHVKLMKEGVPTIVLPLHREVRVGLLISQIKRAGLTVEQFLALVEK